MTESSEFIATSTCWSPMMILFGLVLNRWFYKD